MPETLTPAAITPELRAALFKAWGNSCAYCKRQPAEQVDHIFPKAKGGGDYLENYVASCQGCNADKRDGLLEEGFLRIKQIQARRKVPKVIENLERQIRKAEREKARELVKQAVERERKKAAERLERERARAESKLIQERKKFHGALSRERPQRNCVSTTPDKATSLPSGANKSGLPHLGLSDAQLKTREKHIRTLVIAKLFRAVGHGFRSPPLHLFTEDQLREIEETAEAQFGEQVGRECEGKSNSALGSRAKMLRANKRHKVLPSFTTGIQIKDMLEISEVFCRGKKAGDAHRAVVDLATAMKWSGGEKLNAMSATLDATFTSPVSSDHLMLNCTWSSSSEIPVDYEFDPLLPKFLRLAHSLRTQKVILPEHVLMKSDDFSQDECFSQEQMAARLYQKIVDRYADPLGMAKIAAQ
jgi:hypothetical protein